MRMRRRRKTDVEALHIVVQRAQTLPHADQLPFRALFEAYDAVVAERGADPDHDPVYFRFLLRLGSVPGSGSLLEKFQRLLSSMGIDIEFYNDGSEIHEDAGELVGAVDDAAGSDDPAGSDALQVPQPQQESRRASFSNFQDTLHEASLQNTNTETTRPRRVSASAIPQGHKDNAQSSVGGLEQPKQTSSRYEFKPVPSDLGYSNAPKSRASSSQSVALSQPPLGPRLKKDGGARQNKEDDLTGSSLSTDTTVEIRPRLRPTSRGSATRKELPARGARRPSAVARGELQDDISAESPPLVAHQLIQDLIYRPSPTQMLADSQTFYRHHLTRTIRHCLRTWHEAATRDEAIHRRLDQKAVNFDRRILLREALDKWRTVRYQKRQLAETERFYAVLERRAKKARDLYLLTKAFTHWAQLAHEGVMRTCVARRHLLRVKYFNTWRDVTAVNELKVRRFGLKQFFSRWKDQLVELLTQEVQAVATYRENLTRKVYWAWFWNFCERRAPEWHKGLLKRRYVNKWADLLLRQRERSQYAQDVRDEKLVKKCLSVWSERLQVAAAQHEAADRQRRKTLLKGVLSTWRIQARLNPIARRTSCLVDWRVACTAMRTWKAKADAERHAAYVNKMRIMQNAWTTWNDRLRIQSLAAQIDERVVQQALYKWVLAERSVLLGRLFEHRLQQRAMTTMVRRWSEQQAQFQEIEQGIQRRRDQRTLISTIRGWRMKLQQQREQSALALRFHKPRITTDIIRQWIDRTGHVRTLHESAMHAEYYFLATKTIRCWKSAVTKSRRRKRLAAYGQVRRKYKMNLARRLLLTWKQRAADVSHHEAIAHGTYQQHLGQLGTNLFEVWRSRTWQLAEMSEDALATRHSNVLQSVIGSWRERVRGVQDLGAKADYQAEFLALKKVATYLRKFSLLAFQYRNHERNAEDFKIRSDRQRVRQMFRYWREKSEHRTIPSLQSSLLGGGGRPSRGSIDGVPAGRMPPPHGTSRDSALGVSSEDYNGPDDPGGGGQQSQPILPPEPFVRHTPLPAYLNTPSSRAARASALLLNSTAAAATPRTPRTTTTTTPFVPRARTQLFTDRRSLRRDNNNNLGSSMFGPARRRPS
ncbi:MAG: 5'-3' exoribonuclease 2 [Watsoniomyces obsoletus]|nr:MAG: 5'-3' exoribonuclease 2 [Watsoniomyces obsoletus]